MLKLRTLLTLRNRLAAQQAGYKTTQMEQKRLPRQQALEVLDIYADVIGKLSAKIEDLERSILELIQEDLDMKISLDLITSIKGVGLITATYFIVYTHNFTRFKSWRKFACYSGIAPFKNESGNMNEKPGKSPSQ